MVVAAGSGARFGGPKQWERLGDRRVVDWSLAAAGRLAAGVVLVAPPGAPAPPAEATRVVPGGATRSASVRAGLAAVPREAEVVVVHDAARPLAPPALFDAVVAAVRDGADAAVPGQPVADTLVEVRDGVAVAGVERAALVAVQTPQAFRAEALRAAHRDEPEATDDAGLVRAGGGKVVVVPGDPRNLKLTSPADLVVAAALLGAPPSPEPAGSVLPPEPAGCALPPEPAGCALPPEPAGSAR